VTLIATQLPYTVITHLTVAYTHESHIQTSLQCTMDLLHWQDGRTQSTAASFGCNRMARRNRNKSANKMKYNHNKERTVCQKKPTRSRHSL